MVEKGNGGLKRVAFEEGFDEEIIEEERRVMSVIEDRKRIVKVVVEMNGNGEEFVENVSMLMKTSCENERMNLLKMI